MLTRTVSVSPLHTCLARLAHSGCRCFLGSDLTVTSKLKSSLRERCAAGMRVNFARVQGRQAAGRPSPGAGFEEEGGGEKGGHPDTCQLHEVDSSF